MVCEQMIKQLEENLRRKLTPAEKKKVQEKLHHSESSEHKQEEEPIAA
jgi:hypothetical protein